MNKKVSISLVLLSLWLFGLVARAQDSAAVRKVEMADRLRADGKIYVVVAVLIVILLGLILYVTGLDRKISRLEKEIK
jgi:uncharacterized membrane protein